ncbi:hypothetical protein ACJRO7_027872 [Eucalyptus globulus]|uniref:Mechanosensitive ion channel protein n=1 Tax=Eucalyptus globulus TaxID=34317 RepID=A0ABD3JSN8_EUCGL
MEELRGGDGSQMLRELSIGSEKGSEEKAPAEGSGRAPDDPPSRQASGDVSLDVELEMEELRGGDGSRMLRDPSIGFEKGSEEKAPAEGSSRASDDPPSPLIGRSLHQQWASGDLSLDVELGMEELRGSDGSRMLRDPSIGSEKGSEEKAPAEGSGRALDNRPSPLIGRSLHQQWTSRDLSLDVELEIEELHGSDGSPPAPRPQRQSQDGSRVSCQPPIWTEAGPGVPQRRQEGSPSSGGDRNSAGNREEEVMKRTSSATSHRKSRLVCTKTRSRLADPPEEPQQRSGHIPRSGMLGRAGDEDEDEDDILLEEDLPEELRKTPFGAMALLQWVSLVLIVGALVCTLAIPASKHKDLWKFKLWKWEVLVLVLICGRLVSGWMIRLVVFFMERNFLLRKRVLYFVYGLRNAVQNCLWLGLVSIAWRALFDNNSDGLRYVTKLLLCCLVGALLWLIKTLIIKVLASSFHVRTFFERIQKSLFNQYVIEKLSGPPVIEIRRRQEEENIAGDLQTLQEATVPPKLRAAAFPTESGMVVGSGGLQRSPRVKNTKLSQGLSGNSEGGITIEHLYKLNPKNVSAWNMKRLINMVRHGFHSTLDERIQDSTEEDESATMIRSENEAKAAARKIFRNVAKPNSKFIYLEDLKRFMKDDEALNTMRLFEGADECKRISKSCLKNWLVNAFMGRRALALTLNDTKTAVNKLRHVVNVIVGIVILIIWVFILGEPPMESLFFLSSQLVPLAFLFGYTCKTVFEATLFLFVKHPYGVGDRCKIDGVEMVVEEINILTTVFLRDDVQKIVYPNSTLAIKDIHNYYRSPDMGDEVKFCVHISTPAEKIAAMKHRITGYIDSKKEHWHSSVIIMKDIEELNSVRIVVGLSHTMNHQDMDERFMRRSLLVEEMVKMLRELDIQYRLLPLDINIRAMPASSSTRVPPAWENAG